MMKKVTQELVLSELVLKLIQIGLERERERERLYRMENI